MKGTLIARLCAEEYTNGRHDTVNHSDIGAPGRPSHMGVQQWLGLLSKRRIGSGPGYFDYITFIGPNLNRRHPTTNQVLSR